MSSHSHCSTCGSNAEPLVVREGSMKMQIFLWLFIIPGFFYSMWRESTKRTLCSECGSPAVGPMCDLIEDQHFAHH